MRAIAVGFSRKRSPQHSQQTLPTALRQKSVRRRDFRFGWSRATAFLSFSVILAVALTGRAETFKNPPWIPAPASYQVLAGDLRGTGRLDLICWSTGSSGFYYEVMRNDGERSFTDLGPVVVPSSSVGYVVLGDFNNDGKPDLVVVTSGGTLALFLAGNGDGTFAAPVQSALTGVRIQDLGYLIAWAADMNKDGNLDLVIGSPSGGPMAIASGDGKGDFKFQTNVASTTTQQDVLDLNGDGLPDLIGLDGSGGGLVTAYINQGNWTFKAVTTSSGTKSFYNVHSRVFADVDGDGIPDMVWEDQVDIHFEHGNGDGTFTQVEEVPFPMAVDSTGFEFLFAVTDMNGDGIPDLVFVSDSAATVLLGKGKYQYQVLNPAMIEGYERGPILGDIDGDAHPDIAFLGLVDDDTTEGLYFLWGTAGGVLQSCDGYYSDYSLNGAAEGNFTPGSAPDIALRPLYAKIPEMLKNKGDGTFTLLANPNPSSPPMSGVPPLSYEYTPLAADFFGNGKTDLLEYGLLEKDVNGDDVPSTVLQVWPGNGIGTLGTAVAIPGYASMQGVNGPPINVAIAGDLIGNGREDIAVAYQGAIDILLAQADGKWVKSQTISDPNITPLTTLGFADFNNDGEIDFVAISGQTIQTYLGNGDGTFQVGPTTVAPSSTLSSAVVVADIDGDGKPDILSANNQLTPFYGRGNGSFEQGAAIPFSPSQDATVDYFTVADVNQDGWPDIVVRNGSGIRILHGLGDRTWDIGPYYIGGSMAVQPMVADLNSDGFPDIAVAGDSGPMVAVLLNQPGASDLKGTMELSPNFQPVGSSSLSATVTLQPGIASQALPTGSVSVTIDGAAAGTGTLSNGTVSIPLTNANSLGVGLHWVVASYSGDGTYHAARLTAHHEVFTTQIHLSAAPLPATYGSPLEITADAGAPTGTPDGDITFFDGTTKLETTTLNSAGKATFTIASPALGKHTFSATYSGAPGFPANSSNTLVVTVLPEPTETRLTVTPDPANVRSSVTFSAAVKAADGKPQGMVTFHAGDLSFAPVRLNSEGVAELVLDTLPAGAIQVVADYAGDHLFAASRSKTVAETIDRLKTRTALTCTPLSVLAGKTVTCTIEVTSPHSIPTGQATLFNGAAALGEIKLVEGKATYATDKLTAGQHSLHASFAENKVYAESNSAIVKVTVRLN
jgi:Bacterial Ig-like domain (group 3)/FG-GAP-like repeat